MPNSTLPADAGGLPRQAGYRALDVMDRIPAMHEGVMVTSHDFAPHLQRGEVAVVDTEDKSTQIGELFVIKLSADTPRESLAIVQLSREVEWVGPSVGLMYAFSMRGVGGMMFEGRRRPYADGPVSFERWAEKCLGRIVGVMKPRWEGRS